MQLFLIRHAQSANNALPENQRVEDPGLTTLGQQQARMLGEWIPQLGLTHLIVSPFLRTLLTAREIHKTTGLTPEIRAELHEVGGCYSGYTHGRLEGRPGMNRAEIAEQFPDWRISDSICERGWWKSQPYESYEQAQNRANSLVKQTQSEFTDPEMRIAYVMHADFKTIFLEQFHQEPLSVPWNTSVTQVCFQSEQPKMLDFNRTEHLSEALLTW